VKRLRQEAMTAGRLQHANIVTIYDVGETEQGPFIAMEYLDGVTLRDVISAGKRVSFHQLADIISQVASGLDYAHDKAIVHRDIKPANIMIAAEPVNRVKIMDLGIARLPMSELTKEGKLVGSPSYMSPEQLSGKTIDGRSDLFSLGVCIYQLMTLKKPFPGESINEICYKIVHDGFIPPSQHLTDLPPDLDDFMAIALAKDPGDRFQTGRELAEAVQVIAEREEGAPYAAGPDRGAETAMVKDVGRPEEQSASGTSNPNLTQSSTIDDIFKELTHTARLVDLSRQQTSAPLNWRVLIAVAAALAAVLVLIILLTRS